MSLQLVAFSRLTKYLYFRVDLRRMTLFIKPKSFKKERLAEEVDVTRLFSLSALGAQHYHPVVKAGIAW